MIACVKNAPLESGAFVRKSEYVSKVPMVIGEKAKKIRYCNSSGRIVLFVINDFITVSNVVFIAEATVYFQHVLCFFEGGQTLF